MFLDFQRWTDKIWQICPNVIQCNCLSPFFSICLANCLKHNCFPLMITLPPLPLGLEQLPHECKFCQSSMREQRSLRSLRRSHGGEKPYQCKHCGKRFSLKHQLDTHLRVHTGTNGFIILVIFPEFVYIIYS